MSNIQDYGGLLLGSRLRRLSEQLYTGVDEVYRARGVKLSSRSFPILMLLRDRGPMGIVELAEALGQTHPAVTQMGRKLLAEGVVANATDPEDSRRRLLKLTAKGKALMEKLAGVWRGVALAAEDLAAESGMDFSGGLALLDASLGARSFSQRIEERIRLLDGEEVEVVPFAPGDGMHFKRLNVEWLEKHFYVEAIDEKVLSRPEKHILEPGGFIFMARHRGEVVGTCALIREGDRFELSKMAVTERFQGLGIGRKLLDAAIAQFRKTGARQLFLESNSKLGPALHLYESRGFKHEPKAEGVPHYQRADVHMVYRGP